MKDLREINENLANIDMQLHSLNESLAVLAGSIQRIERVASWPVTVIGKVLR